MTTDAKRCPRAIVRPLGWRSHAQHGPLWAVSYLDDDGDLIRHRNGRPLIESHNDREEAMTQAARSVEMMRATPGGFIPTPAPRPLGTGDVW